MKTVDEIEMLLKQLNWTYQFDQLLDITKAMMEIILDNEKRIDALIKKQEANK